MTTTTDYKIRPFKTPAVFRAWLDAHHADTPGLWLKLHKKASGLATITYAEALDIALCYGWIDGQKKGYDEISFLLKFTPRRKASLWSKQNIEHVARLTTAGLMHSAGIAEVERAQADGRWAAAYDTPSEMTVPEEFLSELRKHPQAQAYFDTLKKSDHYAIAWRLRTAKTEETRLRRQGKILGMLSEGAFK